MEIHLHITAERMESLTWDDYIALEELSEGKPRFRGLRDVVAKFLQNGDGKYLSAERAYAVLGKLSRAQMAETAKQLNEGMANVVANPPHGGS